VTEPPHLDIDDQQKVGMYFFCAICTWLW